MKIKAIELIEKADWKSLLQMSGFVFNKSFLKGHLVSSIKLMNEKQLNDFIDFFDDSKL